MTSDEFIEICEEFSYDYGSVEVVDNAMMALIGRKEPFPFVLGWLGDNWVNLPENVQQMPLDDFRARMLLLLG